jgi:hypothetical protein
MWSEEDPPGARPRALRWLYVSLGCTFVGLGVAGALLPLLPTTPFMLLALWAFARSSPRLERWLLEHRRWGPPLSRWRAHRVIPRSAKLVSWSSMAVSLTWMIVWSPAPPWSIAAAAAVMAYGAWFIARCPSRPPAPSDEAPLTPRGR